MKKLILAVAVLIVSFGFVNAADWTLNLGDLGTVVIREADIQSVKDVLDTQVIQGVKIRPEGFTYQRALRRFILATMKFEMYKLECGKIAVVEENKTILSANGEDTNPVVE